MNLFQRARNLWNLSGGDVGEIEGTPLDNVQKVWDDILKAKKIAEEIIDMPKEILRKIDRLIKENKTQELEQMLKLFPKSKNYIEARLKDKR